MQKKGTKQKNRHKKKRRKETTPFAKHPLLNFGLLAKDTTEQRANVAKASIKRPAALARFWHKFVWEERAFAVRGFFYYRAKVAIERRQTARPVFLSRLFGFWISAFGWMDRFELKENAFGATTRFGN